MKNQANSKPPVILQRCDKCHCVVIDEVTKFDEYTETKIVDDKLHIGFYCPDCIKKYGIVTDANNDNLFDEVTG